MYLTLLEVKECGNEQLATLPDEVLSGKILHYSNMVDEYCNTTFRPTMDKYKVDLKSNIIPRKLPLLMVNEVNINGITSIEDQDYFAYLEENRLLISDISKYKVNPLKAVELTYTFGYEEIPATVKDVVMKLLKNDVGTEEGKENIESETWEDYTYKRRSATDVESSILKALDKFIQKEVVIKKDRAARVRIF